MREAEVLFRGGIRQVPALLALSVLLGASPQAFAHAVLVRSAPADGATIHSRAATFTLDYNSRIDARRSILLLSGPSGAPVTLQMQPSSGPADLKASAVNLKNGNYRLTWQVLASDGHITRGSISFTVEAK